MKSVWGGFMQQATGVF